MLKKDIQSIQILRGFAAIAIVFIHMNGIIRHYGANRMYLFDNTEIANAGVDVFFVISGIIMALITHPLRAQHIKAHRFFLKRITRIYPIYWIYLALFLLGNLIMQGSLPETESNLSFAAILQSFSLFPSQDLPILIIAWTLKFEMFFYVLFASLIIIKGHEKKVYLYAISIILVVAGTLFQFENAIWKQMTDPLLLEFTAGVFIGSLFLSKKQIPPVLFLAIGFVMVILEIYGFSVAELLDMYGTRFGRLVRFGLPAIFIVTGFLFANKIITTYAPKLLSDIGDASYSLYLSHLLVLSFAGKIWSLLHLNSYLHDALFAFYLLTACLIWALLSFRYIELPLIQLARKHLSSVK